MIILFWICLIIVFYTYIGYCIILIISVKIKEIFVKRPSYKLPRKLPDVTLFITAYNEQDVVREKMKNCLLLNYPKDKLHIVWVTDGCDDNTNDLLNLYSDVKVYFQPKRKGKVSAMNRGMNYVHTPIVVFTDANTLLNKDSIKEVVKCFTDPKVGCVSGGKRIVDRNKDNAVGGGEGFYWKYESFLKDYDSRLYSAVGAAGELFAIRTDLYTPMRKDTLLDDFMLSMNIAANGYKIVYCKGAFATEEGSAGMKDEQTRKVRISAGGIQSIRRLRRLYNIFKYRTLSFQYISHRVLRWSVTPFMLLALLPINLLIVLFNPTMLYVVFFIIQILFYLMAIIGDVFANKQIKKKVFFIPYYFLFMNINVLRGISYLYKYIESSDGIWEKSKRR